MAKITSSPSKSIALSKDWTKGSIIQNILLLSWPMIVLGILYTLNLIFEMIWVGKLGAGTIFLKIAILGFPGISIVYVLQSSISGAGDTMPPMLINLAMLWVVQLPLAFLLSRYTYLGVYGVRWAIVIGIVIGAIAFIIYFWGGRWKRKKV